MQHDTAKKAESVFCDSVNDLVTRLRRTSWRAHKLSSPWEACACAVILALEPECTMRKVANALPYATREYSYDDFLDTMANIGYLARPAYLDPHEIDDRLMPCLFLSEGKVAKPYVMISRNYIYDCSRQTFVTSLPDLKGEVWFFEEFSEARSGLAEGVRKTNGLTWFRTILKRFTQSYWQILMIGLVLNLVALSSPLFIMVVYDRVISAHAIDILPMLAAGVAIAIAAEWFLRQAQSAILSGFACRLDNVVSTQIFTRLLGLAPGYIERASVPAQVARLKTFESVRDFFSGAVFLSVLELPFSIIALIAIATIAGPLFLVPLSVTVLYILLFSMVWRRVRVSIREAARATSARQQFSLETLEKIRAIRTFGLSDIWHKKFEELSAKESITHLRLQWLGNIGETLAHGLTILASVAVVGFGVHLIWAGQMTAGALVATMILCWRVLTPFYSLCTMVPRLDQLRNSVRQVNELMAINEEKAVGQSPAKGMAWQGVVSFNNVGLRYPGDVNPVFSGLNFTVNPGELALITGDNGSGKTSLLKMILGMYLPQAGAVQIDHHDIRQMDPQDLRRHIAYIPQYPHFFEGTIDYNLRLAHPLATPKEIEFALRQANIWEEIQNLPEKAKTLIDPGSDFHMSTSMGLRLCMARAYLHNAPILLIDELPNSLMSDQAGVDLVNSLVKLKKGRTVFMVTYRNDLMGVADHVIMLRRRRPPVTGPAKLIYQKLKELS